MVGASYVFTKEGVGVLYNVITFIHGVLTFVSSKHSLQDSNMWPKFVCIAAYIDTTRILNIKSKMSLLNIGSVSWLGDSMYNGCTAAEQSH